MNSSTRPSTQQVDLKIRRRSGLAAAIAEPIDQVNRGLDGYHRMAEDLADLRTREEHLRAYEQRLRALQEEVEAGRTAAVRPPAPTFSSPSSRHPFDDGSLQSAWDKLYRARALLEAEQSHLRDDRLSLADEQKRLSEREERLAAREALLATAQAVAAAASVPSVAVMTETESAISRLTKAPFSLAKSVFTTAR
jgi:hypothetical protein